MSGEPYRIGHLRGGFCLYWYDKNGKRHRRQLDAKDARGAECEAPGVYAILTRPRGTKVGQLWDAYTKEYAGRAIVGTMEHTCKAIRERFWGMEAGAISKEDCEAHVRERRKTGISDWTIYTELSHLSNVIGYARKAKLITQAPHIFRPAQPMPKEDKHLTRTQVRQLIAAAQYPHVRLAIILLYTTAARSAALRGLTWERVDFGANRIDLRDPKLSRPHKGRAIVPLLRSTKVALREAQKGALSEYVIEWGGKPVGSLKRGIKRAAKLAAVTKSVSPHILRHSAAVHMAESGVSMEEIQQFLGHSDIKVTRRIYARFSPDYLRDAAKALEIDDLGSLNQREKNVRKERSNEIN